MNDNSPAFTMPSYSCFLCDSASRGQLVFKVVALDPDEVDVDNLLYSIVDGNQMNTFSMNSDSGVITLSEQRQPDLGTAYTLNVSVSDGVYTSFTMVSVDVRSTNHYTPAFSKNIYDVEVSEFQETGATIISVTAVDEDRGNYGMVAYSIISDEMAKKFSIDADTGKI